MLCAVCVWGVMVRNDPDRSPTDLGMIQRMIRVHSKFCYVGVLENDPNDPRMIRIIWIIGHGTTIYHKTIAVLSTSSRIIWGA